MRTPAALVLSGMLLGSPPAVGECACLCADGRWQTMCTSPQERAVSGDRCLQTGLPGEACPPPPETDAGRYPAPVEGVGNCRRLQVYDAARDTFIGARVCDLHPAD